jgi:hypothetical protein
MKFSWIYDLVLVLDETKYTSQDGAFSKLQIYSEELSEEAEI